MTEGLLVTAEGMALVFGALGALMLVMLLLGRLFKPGKGEEKES